LGWIRKRKALFIPALNPVSHGVDQGGFRIP
jgi:hypothetical protein